LAVTGLALAASCTAYAQAIFDVTGDPNDVLEAVLEDLDKRRDAELGLLEWREALGFLDGTWEGPLTVIAATEHKRSQFWDVGDRPELQIVVEHGAAAIRVKADEWQAVNVAGGFQAVDLTGGGFVYAGQSANGWVENWNLSVVKQNPDTLLVFLSFVAGKTLDRLDAVDGPFAVAATGELKRRTE
jgi:hypothetical protein